MKNDRSALNANVGPEDAPSALENTHTTGTSDGQNGSTGEVQITGRAVFKIDTSAAGIVVRTAFLGEQGQLIDMPAVFPDLGYALSQIDHLRQIVIDRFSQAAQVGVQVISAQQAPQGAAPAPDSHRGD